MHGYRKPSGVYFEVQEGTPVSAACVRVALRPSTSHVFADAWDASPLDPAVCWRVKTAAEQTAEKDTDLQTFLDSPSGKVAKTLATILIQKGVCTMAEIRQGYRALN